MSLTIWLIAKLSRVDADLARRALSTARAQDEIDAPAPADLERGGGAMAYGLALFVSRRPVHFYVGLLGLLAFFGYMFSRFALAAYEFGIHQYGQ
ncbi:hypothetical protein QYH69_24020 [Paraburkholderia sp. SARCC-3016]|uniref:hypothetical protein n=1 Tax=Paraburkholderia sp. SARCC-3016 TaxID=3058611 RepID=UPI002808B553|nr:hypothetical protein [Paraburkholderia sp. SARCC-3016]MDQ7980310.1 hypothetical protein [Paraburkholderia sp. SARCC-3016]